MVSSNAEKVPKKPEFSLSTDIEPNILDQFDSPTYHFRLYLQSPDSIRKQRFGREANGERVVIAESGVGPIEIDEVEIYSVAGLSKEAGIGQATRFSFTLREPHGAILLDRIGAAARALGIENFSKIPFFLELSFKAQKAEGTTEEAQGDLRELVWTWPLIMTKMAMNVNTGGSTYALQAAIYGDLAYTNQSSDIEQSVNIEAATVGEFFTQLQEQLNAREEQKDATSNYKFADTYEFYVDEQIFNEKIVPGTVEERLNRSASYNSDNGKMNFSFQPPISIDRIVENVLSLTSFFQKKIKATEDPDAAGDDLKGEEAIFQTLYRLVADSALGEYDTTRQDYQKNFRYLIIPYEMTTVQTPSNIASAQTDQQRYNAAKRRGRIKKLYNYIYTGLNDQVLDFELNFNFNWYAALPLQAGVSTNFSSAEPAGKLTLDQKSLAKEAAQNIPSLSQFAAGPIGFSGFELPSVFADAAAAAAGATNAISAANLQASDAIGDQVSAADAATSTIQNGIAQSPVDLPGVAQAATVPAISGQDSLIERLASGTRFPRVTPNTNQVDLAQRNRRSIDIQLDDPDLGARAEKVFKTSIQEAASGTNAADGQDFASRPGQTMLSAMFEQARSPVAADLLSIDLKIKGDPYWLEPAPTKQGYPPSSNFRRLMANRKRSADGGGLVTTIEGGEQNLTTVDTASDQTLMVFRSFTPKEFDPETGLTPAGKDSNNALNGVYGIRTVTHIFSGGQFTQDLHAIRDVHITLRNVDLFADERSVIDGNTELEEISLDSLRKRLEDDGFGNTPPNTRQGVAGTGTGDTSG